jgi:hypothetical protein
LRLPAVSASAPSALAGTAETATSYPATTLSLGVLGDSGHSRSHSLSTTLAGSAQWSFNASAGLTTISNQGVSLAGDSRAAGLAWQPGDWSVEPGYSRWHDDDQFSNETPELKVSRQHDALRWQLSAERPRYGIDYQLGAGPLAVQRQFEFSGTGLQAILAAPNLVRFPRLSLLAESCATLAEGAASHRWYAGVERGFTRISWHADATLQTDALAGAQASSLSLGANLTLGAHTSLDASVGNQHAEGLGDAAFINLILGFHC